jgi:hypothetical protein
METTMADDLRGILLKLADYIDVERIQLRKTLDLYMNGDLSIEKEERLFEFIRQRGELRHQRADDIAAAARDVEKNVAVILFRASRACRAGESQASDLLEQAAAELQSGPPGMPVVKLEPPEIEDSDSLNR